jgi:hypothetical protein
MNGGLRGYVGPLTLGCLLVSSAMAGMVRGAATRGAGIWTILLALAIAFPSMAVHVTTRPHLVTWALLIPWVAWWIQWGEGQLSSFRLSVYSVPTLILWANLHGGFVLGIVFAGLLVLSTFLASVQEQTRRSLAVKGSLLWIFLLLSGCVNPYGFKIYVHIFSFLSNRYVTSGTNDLRMPDFWTASGLFIALWVIVSVVIVWSSRRSVFDRYFVITSFFGVLALASIRNAAIFTVIVFPLVTSEAERLLSTWTHCRVVAQMQRSSERLSQLLQRGGGAWALLSALVLVLGYRAPNMPDRHLPPNAPQGAISAIDPSFAGNGFTDFAYGGFIAWSRPALVPFIHPLNAIYPESRLKAYSIYLMRERE